MKRMKKVWALVLALVMVLALGVTNAAADPAPTTMDFVFNYLGYGDATSIDPKGGVFTMTNKNDLSDVHEATVNESGIGVFTGLKEGAYTLTQKTIPLGFEDAEYRNSTTLEVKISNGEFTDVNGGSHNGIHAEFAYGDGNGYQWPGAAEQTYSIPVFKSHYTMVTIRIPFTKKVTLGGNAAPGSQKFELKITPAVTVNVKTTAEVETTGTKTSYPGTITIEGAKSQVKNLVNRGFAVEEVNGGAANWTYSDVKYNVMDGQWDGTGNPSFNLTKENTEGGTVDATALTFENIYTRNVSFYYNNNTTTTETKGSPKTFDAGIGVYAVSALLSVTGGAWLVGKKHK